VAPEKAFMNSCFFVIKLRETKVLVSVVPILAPNIMGIARCISSEPLATMATIMEVVVELLCIMAVTSNPINKLTKGFVVISSMDWAKFLLDVLRPDIRRSIEKRKRNKARKM